METLKDHSPEVLRYAAFTDAGQGGNPAGIVLDASALDPVHRLAVAAEVGYSETAFIEKQAPGEFRVRYFSPQAEVTFCGHATIAAAVAIADREGLGLLRFSTLAGDVDVRTAAGSQGTVATLTSVPSSTRPVESEALERALAALGWSENDLDPRYPAHVAYAGAHHLILAVRDRETLAALDYDFDGLAALMAEKDWTTLDLVWAESPNLFHARNPFPPGGVVEDPATGAAAAAFGGYLRALGLVELPAEVTIIQGVDMGRPSRLLVELDPASDRVKVSGSAAPITAAPTTAAPTPTEA